MLISSTQPSTTLHVQDGYHGQKDLLRGTHNHGLICNISLFVSLEQFEVFKLAEGVVYPPPDLVFKLAEGVVYPPPDLGFEKSELKGRK